MITVKVKENIFIPQGQESLLKGEGEVHPELETSKAYPVDEDSEYLLIKIKAAAIEPSTEFCNPRTGNIHIWQQ